MASVDLSCVNAAPWRIVDGECAPGSASGIGASLALGRGGVTVVADVQAARADVVACGNVHYVYTLHAAPYDTAILPQPRSSEEVDDEKETMSCQRSLPPPAHLGCLVIAAGSASHPGLRWPVGCIPVGG